MISKQKFSQKYTQNLITDILNSKVKQQKFCKETYENIFWPFE